MAKLSEQAIKLIAEIRPALIATASKTGKPNVSAKGSLRLLDDEHVIFADVASPRTVANINENPQVSIICLDASKRTSCRIWGKAEVLNSGDIFEKIATELSAKNVKLKNVVKITVDEVETT